MVAGLTLRLYSSTKAFEPTDAGLKFGFKYKDFDGVEGHGIGFNKDFSGGKNPVSVFQEKNESNFLESESRSRKLTNEMSSSF